MKITFGALVTEGTGKLGGHTAQRGRAGAVLRTIGSIKKSATQAQSLQRQNVQMLSQSWRTLTNEQRQSWIDNAKPKQSGFDLYMQTNLNLLHAGLPIISYFIATNSFPKRGSKGTLRGQIADIGGFYLLNWSYNDWYNSIPAIGWTPLFKWTGWYAPSVYKLPKANKIVNLAGQTIQASGINLSFADEITQLPSPPGIGYKTKIDAYFINNSTGTIYKYQSLEIIADNFQVPEQTYTGVNGLDSASFSTDGMGNTATNNYGAFPGVLDFDLWLPEFYFSGWSPFTEESQQGTWVPIPLSAITLPDSTTLRITYSYTEGSAPEPTEENAYGFVSMQWRNIETNEIQFTGISDAYAGNF